MKFMLNHSYLGKEDASFYSNGYAPGSESYANAKVGACAFMLENLLWGLRL